MSGIKNNFVVSANVFLIFSRMVKTDIFWFDAVREWTQTEGAIQKQFLQCWVSVQA
jgi:hypothetical protein